LPASSAPVRIRLRLRGTVQGVGFRPWCVQLARRFPTLSGWVANDAEGVLLEIQGTEEGVAAYRQRLLSEPPPLARIASCESSSCPPLPDAAGFFIRATADVPAISTIHTDAPADTAICAACLDELFDPRDRRYRYPFINCTHCGPRYTLIRSLPYDRSRTGMSAFPLCPECAAEYADPLNRRYHAQPNACPVCGPRCWLVSEEGRASATDEAADPFHEAARRIRAGEILALKSLGGFHLACDARQSAAVARLRARKERSGKPFALMVANLASARRWARLDAAHEFWLQSPRGPIVLAPKTLAADEFLPQVSPGLDEIGLMLPQTPLHWLLFHELANRPQGRDWQGFEQEAVLVMTSANPGGDPLVTQNDEALNRLRGLADAFLMHDRPIVARCDDSVLRPARTGEAETTDPPALQFLRRARGWTPDPIPLAARENPEAPSVLACGAFLKNTVCMTRGAQAFLSPHIGDLESAATRGAFEETVAHLHELLGCQPALVAHDLHPDFSSTRFAQDYAARHGIPALAVQHHHAHLAAVLAEHGIAPEPCAAPVLGLALDGVGLGEDGEIWGGELMRLDGARMTRLAHLRALPLPGGDQAAREPWRVAAAILHELGRGEEIPTRFSEYPTAANVAQLLRSSEKSRAFCPRSSAAGRYFDAAAALLGFGAVNSFEAEAAMRLEAAAHFWCRDHGALPPSSPEVFALDIDGNLDLLPLFERLSIHTTAKGCSRHVGWVEREAKPIGVSEGEMMGFASLNPSYVLLERLCSENAHAAAQFHAAQFHAAQFHAAQFHADLIAALTRWCVAHCERQKIATLALAGGCFLNRLLADGLRHALNERGIRVLEPRLAPPGDGAISLGQAWVALAAWREGIFN